MKKDNLTWGDALVYLEMFARDYSPSPFSYDDIVHIGETTCHHKFTQFDNAENFRGQYACVVYKGNDGIIDTKGNIYLCKDLK